jgi:hypothetical protein
MLRLAMYFPTAIAHQPGINAAVAEIAHELSPAVLHIRYEIGQDWSGDSAIFFRVVLSDEASHPHALRHATTLVGRRLGEKIDFAALGLRPYFNFRSRAEQEKMQEPAWA